MRPELRDRLVSLLGERVRFAVPLARYTSFRLGGPADVFIEPASVTELQAVMAVLSQDRTPYFLLGGGTNLLVSDNGIHGVVVHLGNAFHYQYWMETEFDALVQVGAARPLRFVERRWRKATAE